MSRLNFCIGLPRSGKSSFAKRWLIEGKNRVVLAGDDFRYAVYNRRFQMEGEELVRSALITAARALFHNGHYEILLDETNTSKTNICQILNIDPSAKAYLFNTPKDVCIARAIAHNQLDLLPSIERMNKNIQVLPALLTLGELDIKNIEVVNAKPN